jgi:hypothetical protein
MQGFKKLFRNLDGAIAGAANVALHHSELAPIYSTLRSAEP